MHLTLKSTKLIKYKMQLYIEKHVSFKHSIKDVNCTSKAANGTFFICFQMSTGLHLKGCLLNLPFSGWLSKMICSGEKN
jgi:hypothetical protein